MILLKPFDPSDLLFIFQTALHDTANLQHGGAEHLFGGREREDTRFRRAGTGSRAIPALLRRVG
jgi:hypothetical protein